MLDLARIACLAALIAAFAVCVCGQEADTQTQIWPEVDVYVPIKPKIRLFFIATVTKLEETSDNTEGQVGHMSIFCLIRSSASAPVIVMASPLAAATLSGSTG
ncbi:MAG: hypothetical protein ACRD6N_03525 [Pyrinomonadaceae bacterium]